MEHPRQNASATTVVVPGRPDGQRANGKSDALALAGLTPYLLHGHLNQLSSMYLLSLPH